MDSLNDASNLPKIYIRYCPACGWMLRSAWIAQEALTTFSKEIDSVTLKPDYENAGLFQVWIDDSPYLVPKERGGFPPAQGTKTKNSGFDLS